MPGMILLVDYSVGEMRPMVATALPALDWEPCTRANGVTAASPVARPKGFAWPS